MNLRNTFLTILFTSVFLTQNINISYSQYDSIKGYNDIEFGETLRSAIKTLKQKKIHYDTSKNDIKFPFNSDYISIISYTEFINLLIDFEKINFQLNVKLCFDRNNDNKFFKANYEIKIFASSDLYAKKIFNEFFKIYLEKYGTDYIEYNYLDSTYLLYKINYNFFLGRTLKYEWLNSQASIDLTLDLFNLYTFTEVENYNLDLINDSGYVLFKTQFISSLKETGGEFSITCNYENKELYKLFYTKENEMFEKKRNQEREKLKGNF